MDPADSEQLQAAFRFQGRRLNEQEEQMSAIQQGVKDLVGNQKPKGFRVLRNHAS